MLTKFEQLIYNKYLKLSRQGLPVKYRKNFDNISDEIEICLHKISKFLDVYKHIDLDIFLEAPFKIYNNDTYIPLQFFCTQKARKVYTIYKQQKQLLDVDNDEHIQKIKESLKFIYKYCKQQNVNIIHYLSIENQTIPVFLQHLKNGNIDLYVLFGFNNFQQYIDKVPTDIIVLMYNNLYEDIDKCYTKFITSTRCKSVIKNGIKQLEDLFQ